MSDPGNDLPLRRYVAYYRVSTDRQGRSGLGLEAQREAAARYISARGGSVVAEFEEVESGRRSDRPRLAAALAACQARRATLLIAKLDRLSRNAGFLLGVVRGAGEGGVVFCDLPDVPPGPVGAFLVTQMAAVAELEAGLISQRTRAALAALKARGRKLGSPNPRKGTRTEALAASASNAARARERAEQHVLPILREAREAGARTLAELAGALDHAGVATARGRPWSVSSVRDVLRRTGADLHSARSQGPFR